MLLLLLLLSRNGYSYRSDGSHWRRCHVRFLSAFFVVNVHAVGVSVQMLFAVQFQRRSVVGRGDVAQRVNDADARTTQRRSRRQVVASAPAAAVVTAGGRHGDPVAAGHQPLEVLLVLPPNQRQHQTVATGHRWVHGSRRRIRNRLFAVRLPPDATPETQQQERRGRQHGGQRSAGHPNRPIVIVVMPVICESKIPLL